MLGERERAVLHTELDRIEQVIELAGVPVERNGRDLQDWLAQVLQVLVLDAGCAKTLRARGEQLTAALREVKDAITNTFDCNHPERNDDGSDGPCDGDDCIRCWSDSAIDTALAAPEQKQPSPSGRFEGLLRSMSSEERSAFVEGFNGLSGEEARELVRQREQKGQAQPPPPTCPHCAAGLPLSAEPGHHWTGNMNPPKCEARATRQVREDCPSVIAQRALDSQPGDPQQRFNELLIELSRIAKTENPHAFTVLNVLYGALLTDQAEEMGRMVQTWSGWKASQV